MNIQQIFSVARYNIISRDVEVFNVYPDRDMLTLQLANLNNFPISSVTVDNHDKVYEIHVEYHTKSRIIAYRWQDKQYAHDLRQTMASQGSDSQIAFENTMFIDVDETTILQWLEKAVDNPVNTYQSGLIIQKVSQESEEKSASYKIELNGETLDEFDRAILFSGQTPEKLLEKWIKAALESEVAQSYIYASIRETQQKIEA